MATAHLMLWGVSASTRRWVRVDQDSRRPMIRAWRSSSIFMSLAVPTGAGAAVPSVEPTEASTEPTLHSLDAVPGPVRRESSAAQSSAKRRSRPRSSLVQRWRWKHSIMAAALQRNFWPLPAATTAAHWPPVALLGGTARSAAERRPSTPAARSPKGASRLALVGVATKEEAVALPPRNWSISCRLSISAACAASASAASEKLRASASAARASALHCSRPSLYSALASDNIVLMADALAAATDIPASKPGNCANSSWLR
mmetsp:Transcript_105543/g.336087  ORF Transcript_105543/g.336087 Transcript_105543/m.336087 type:complete len:259 (-) Transcript_105543:483-1259(-)